MCDDVFDEEDDFDVRLKDWKKVERSVKTDAYTEGVVHGQDQSLQQGFNDGYTQFVSISFQLAKCRGIINALIGNELLHQGSDEAKGTKMSEELQQLLEEIVAAEKNITTAKLTPSIKNKMEKSTEIHCQEEVTQKGDCPCVGSKDSNDEKTDNIDDKGCQGDVCEKCSCQGSDSVENCITKNTNPVDEPFELFVNDCNIKLRTIRERLKRMVVGYGISENVVG